MKLDGEWERKRLREYRRKRDLAVTQLSAIDGVTCASPDGAMYVFPQFTDCLRAKGVADDLQACRELREREGLSVVAGSVFGAPGALRLSYGVEDDRLEAALARIGRWASH